MFDVDGHGWSGGCSDDYKQPVVRRGGWLGLVDRLDPGLRMYVAVDNYLYSVDFSAKPRHFVKSNCRKSAQKSTLTMERMEWTYVRTYSTTPLW